MRDPSVTDIGVPFPESGDLQLKISVGACRLRVRPGEGELWVGGSYRDPSGAFPCRVDRDGGNVRITQEHDLGEVLSGFGGLPATFELTLGKAKGFALYVETGASDGDIDLGGVPVDRLQLQQGAGKIAVDFSAPNPSSMSLLKVGNGASAMDLTRLANANCTRLELEGGAASYTLDFGGTLQRDMQAKITTGVSAVEIRVPSTTAARITTETVLGSVDIGDGFMKKQGAFWTEAALAGQTPLLTITASVTLGAVRLRAL